MKNSNKHLDDLFAAARREEPVISEDNARDLLTKSEHMQPSPFIFSTKGIIMSTIGLSLATFIGYLALSGSPTALVSKSSTINTPVSNLLTHSVSQSTEETKKSDDKVAKKLIIVKKSGDEIPPSLPPIITTPMKIAGIKSIELASEKFAAMGIAKKDDGSVGFTQKNSDGRIFAVSFPKNTWEINVGDSYSIQSQDSFPSFAPLIVTDTKGNKRLMQFSTNENGKEIRAMKVNSRFEDSEITPFEVVRMNKNLIKIKGNIQFGNENDEADFVNKGQDSIALDHYPNIIKEEIKKEIKQIKDDSASGKPKNFMVMKIKKTIHLDSTLKAGDEAVRRSEKELDKVISKLHLENLDSLSVNLKELQLEESNIENDRDDMEDISGVLDLLEKRESELNNLIPVLVRQATSEHFDKSEGITYNDGLIFWYSPEKDVLANIPKAAAENSLPPASASNILTKTVLYPNPAQNKTTLHFTLAEPRTIAFSIHDLLGKRVLDGGSIAETSAGSYEHEINLSSLTAGVYLLVITTDKGEQSIERLVIEK